MNKEKSLLLLEKLANANGAPGFEEEVLEVIRIQGAGLGEFSEDSLRNLYLRRKENTGSRPVVQLDAHTDEVGFMVQAITPAGCLRFIPLGSWVAANVAAQKVRVRNADGGYIPGVIASKPPHFLSEEDRKKPSRMEDMVIDIGAISREEAIKTFRVRVGAPVVPDTSFTYQEDRDLMIAKAFDCRMGCACILDVLDSLRGQELNVDVVAGFSVQEETGYRGAKVTSQVVRPDIALVFEGSPADDTFSESYMIQNGLKRGPMLRHIDAGMITNPRFLRYALELADRLGIPFQESVRTGGYTNGSAIHTAYGGVPVVVIGLPVRYIHAHYSIASYRDYDNAVKLGLALVQELNEAVIKGF